MLCCSQTPCGYDTVADAVVTEEAEKLAEGVCQEFPELWFTRQKHCLAHAVLGLQA